MGACDRGNGAIEDCEITDVPRRRAHNQGGNATCEAHGGLVERLDRVLDAVGDLSRRIGTAGDPLSGEGSSGLCRLFLGEHAKLVALEDRFDSMRPQVDELKHWEEATQVQTREQLVDRAHRAEAQLERLHEERMSALRRVVVALVLGTASGFGGTELVKLFLH